MIAEIDALIAETESWLAFHRMRRDKLYLSQHDREREGIEALACQIRLKALRQCREIIMRNEMTPEEVHAALVHCSQSPTLRPLSKDEIMIDHGSLKVHGTMGVLNVGAGDTKLVFDKSNMAERIRAARIVTDMLRRGYALMVEVPDAKGKGKHFVRCTKFDEETCEYIIADGPYAPDAQPEEPVQHRARAADAAEEKESERNELKQADAKTSGKARPQIRRDRSKGRKVDAADTRAVAIARSAGG